MADAQQQVMPLRVRLWVGALTAVAVVAVAVLLAVGPGGPTGLLRPLPLALAAAVAVAEVYTVWESGRPRNLSLTVSELFVGVVVVVLSPGDAIVTLVAGIVIAIVAKTGIGPVSRVPVRSPWVIVHGVALPVVRMAVAIAVAATTEPVLGAVAGAGLGIGALVVVDTLLAQVVVSLETGLPLRRAMGETAAAETVVALVAGLFGVLLGEAIGPHPSAWLIVLFTAALLAAVSYGGTRWARERLRSRVLLEGALATGSQTTAGDVVQELVGKAAEALHAERVEVTDGEPGWAEVTASLGTHGWIGVADRTIRSQAAFDHRDADVLTALASVATVSLDNAVLVERLRSEQRIRTTLLAAAAHDLRSPLAIILGALETLRLREDLNDGDAVWLLDTAERGTSRATRLVQDLIAFERHELGPGRVRTVANPVQVAHEVVQGLHGAGAARVRVRTDGCNVPHVAMSAVLLERVLDNLVSNALRHTPDDEQVDVRVWADGEGSTLIAVEDRGPGVPAADRERILAPFEQAGAGAGAYGLGMHIVTQFVREAGGELQITDRDDGPGASFRVVLPVAAGTRAQAPAPAAG